MPVKRYSSLTLGLFVFGICLQFLGCTVGSKVRRRAQLRKVNNWVCVYVDSVAIEDINEFDLAVLDADAHPSLAPLRRSSTLPVGYVRLDQVADYRWYWDLISDKAFLFNEREYLAVALGQAHDFFL